MAAAVHLPGLAWPGLPACALPLTLEQGCNLVPSLQNKAVWLQGFPHEFPQSLFKPDSRAHTHTHMHPAHSYTHNMHTKLRCMQHLLRTKAPNTITQIHMYVAHTQHTLMHKHHSTRTCSEPHTRATHTFIHTHMKMHVQHTRTFIQHTTLIFSNITWTRTTLSNSKFINTRNTHAHTTHSHQTTRATHSHAPHGTHTPHAHQHLWPPWREAEASWWSQAARLPVFLPTGLRTSATEAALPADHVPTRNLGQQAPRARGHRSSLVAEHREASGNAGPGTPVTPPRGAPHPQEAPNRPRGPSPHCKNGVGLDTCAGLSRGLGIQGLAQTSLSDRRPPVQLPGLQTGTHTVRSAWHPMVSPRRRAHRWGQPPACPAAVSWGWHSHPPVVRTEPLLPSSPGSPSSPVTRTPWTCLLHWGPGPCTGLLLLSRPP